MAENIQNESPEPPSPEELGRSYAALLGGGGTWEVDRGEGPAGPGAVPPAGPEAAEVPPPPPRIVEALLFVGGAPLSAAAACEAVRGLTPELFAQAVDSLNRAYRRQGRPYVIKPQGDGYVLTLRPAYRTITEKLYGTAREARLSAPAIDVLALVAYRQPVTRPEIDSLRGADCAGLLRQLVRRGLVTIVQRAEASKREVYYGTTARFLELFGLRSLDDLPRTQDLQQL
jgi:segregation and condensation protein B